MNKEATQNGTVTKSVTRTVTETSNGIGKGVGITTESGEIMSDDGHVTPTNGHVIRDGADLGVKTDLSISEVRSRLNSDAKVRCRV